MGNGKIKKDFFKLLFWLFKLQRSLNELKYCWILIILYPFFAKGLYKRVCVFIDRLCSLYLKYIAIFSK